ncbi:cytochrome c [Alcaligenes faecalis]|nr:cytochrome c [Alcaligenes faecalis]MBY6316497.1 cytochrome c [Alcaligenes faecalis]MBY6390297.1 cytochrome c [Alcaligenes faecalis]
MRGLHLPSKLSGWQALMKIWLAVLLSLLWPQQATSHEAVVNLERQASLQTLLHQECGSCHGLLLKGGLGPALTADALRGQSAEQIALTIMHGRPGTAMPAWNRFLQPAESLWLADFLLHESDAAP